MIARRREVVVELPIPINASADCDNNEVAFDFFGGLR